MYAMMKIVMMLLKHLNDSLHISAWIEDDCDDSDSRNDLGDDVDDNGHISKNHLKEGLQVQVSGAVKDDGDDLDSDNIVDHGDNEHLKEGLQVQVSGAVHSPLMQPREHQGAQIWRVKTSKY